VAGTPISRILETIEEVTSMHDQIAALEAAVEKLARRVEAIEQASARPPPVVGR